MRRRRLTGRRRLLLLLCLLLTLAACACLLTQFLLGRTLSSQQAAERWQGESATAFAQLSCFVPVDEKLTIEKIYQFRSDIIKGIQGAALDVGSDEKLYSDAWSCTGKALATTDLGKGDAAVIAVGGDFFDFHPIRLLSGSYIREGDLMKDRVLLDEELAWLLFGGTELQGLQLKINGVPFVVAGVIEREQDFASRRAYTSGMGLFMSYEAWRQLEPNAGVTSYELVLAEPVKNFAANLTREKFPIGQGEIVINTGRFAFGRLLLLLGQFGSRSMQKLGVLLPYWENAARCMEDYCSLLCFLTILFALFPVLALFILILDILRRGRNRLVDDVLPAWRDSAEEAVRVRRRRRWERKRGRHEA